MSVTVQDAPDYTGLANVTIVGQIEALEVTGSITVSSGNVEITGPLTASGNIPVAIQESIQLDVNITNSVVNVTGDVTVSSGSVEITGPLTAGGNLAVEIVQSITIDVNITNSVLTIQGDVTVSSGSVDISGPLSASGNVNVAIQESVQIDVNVTNSTLNISGDVTVSSGSVDISGPLTTSGNLAVGIQESVQIDVNVTNSTLNIQGSVTVSSGSVDISGPLTTDGYVAVEITKSITIDVNVTNSTLNITGDVTVSSGSVDISGPLTTEGNVAVAIQQSIQLDVNITNSVINIQGSVDANITNATLTIEGDVNVTNSVLNVSITNEVLQSKLAKPALAFNGENAYVDCGNLPALEQEFSVFVIARRKGSTGTYGSLLNIDGSSWTETGGFTIFDRNDGVIRARIRNQAEATETYVNLETDVPNNVVRKYLVTWKRPDLKGYRDGVLADSTTWDHDVGWDVYKCEIGKWISHYWYGDILQVLIYDHELTEDERNQLFNNPQSPPTNGLIAWWNFDEGSGTTAYDKSGNGNHGTIYNAVWVSEQGQVAPLLNVNISASQVTMDVNVTNASLDVNATIVSSTVTLDVNVTNSSLTVNIGAPLTASGNLATAIQESVQIDINIAASAVTLDVNVTNSVLNIQGDVNITNAELNIRITAQDIDLSIYTPSGRWVVGSDLFAAKVTTGTLAPGGGEEDVILDVTGRGRIKQIGLWLDVTGVTEGWADCVNDAILRIYLDDDVDAGTPTMEIYVYDIDLLNGKEIYGRMEHEWYDDTVTIDSTSYERYYAKHVSENGAVKLAIYDRANTRWVMSFSWLVVNCEFLEKCKITLYNDNANSTNYLYGQATVLYGVYP